MTDDEYMLKTLLPCFRYQLNIETAH